MGRTRLVHGAGSGIGNEAQIERGLHLQNEVRSVWGIIPKLGGMSVWSMRNRDEGSLSELVFMVFMWHGVGTKLSRWRGRLRGGHSEFAIYLVDSVMPRIMIILKHARTCSHNLGEGEEKKGAEQVVLFRRGAT